MKGVKALFIYLAALLSERRDLAPILEMPLTEEARAFLLEMELDWQIALLEHCFHLPPGKYRRV